MRTNIAHLAQNVENQLGDLSKEQKAEILEIITTESNYYNFVKLHQLRQTMCPITLAKLVNEYPFNHAQIRLMVLRLATPSVNIEDEFKKISKLSFKTVSSEINKLLNSKEAIITFSAAQTESDSSPQITENSSSSLVALSSPFSTVPEMSSSSVAEVVSSNSSALQASNSKEKKPLLSGAGLFSSGSTQPKNDTFKSSTVYSPWELKKRI